MTLHLSPLLDAFVNAGNARDAEACVACFKGDAVVHDEGHAYRGTSEIKAWFETVSRKYRPTLTPLNVTSRAGDAILIAYVAGDFDGSPSEITYRFTFSNDKISALHIGTD